MVYVSKALPPPSLSFVFGYSAMELGRRKTVMRSKIARTAIEGLINPMDLTRAATTTRRPLPDPFTPSSFLIFSDWVNCGKNGTRDICRFLESSQSCLVYYCGYMVPSHRDLIVRMLWQDESLSASLRIEECPEYLGMDRITRASSISLNQNEDIIGPRCRTRLSARVDSLLERDHWSRHWRPVLHTFTYRGSLDKLCLAFMGRTFWFPSVPVNFPGLDKISSWHRYDLRQCQIFKMGGPENVKVCASAIGTASDVAFTNESITAIFFPAVSLDQVHVANEIASRIQ